MIEKLIAEFKKRNLKITPQRIIIYQSFIKCDYHPSVTDIHNRVIRVLPNISYNTVHRALATFVSTGLARIAEGSEKPKRYDSNLELHHHFKCLYCGEIEDIIDDSLNMQSIPQALQKKFMIQAHKTILHGTCMKCQEAN